MNDNTNRIASQEVTGEIMNVQVWHGRARCIVSTGRLLTIKRQAAVIEEYEQLFEQDQEQVHQLKQQLKSCSQIMQDQDRLIGELRHELANKDHLIGLMEKEIEARPVGAGV